MARFSESNRVTLTTALQGYSKKHVALPGIGTASRRNTLVAQMIESLRRIEFVKRIATRQIDARRADPASDLFDPLRGALRQFRGGNFDEAMWLVFLATLFGRHLQDGWRLTRDIYRGDGTPWTFARVANDPAAFEAWLAGAYDWLVGDGVSRRFGNHRKYETLRVDAARGAANAVKSYVGWVGANRGHAGLLTEMQANAGNDPKAMFDALYQSMETVISFGRTGRFDYLTMVGKLGFASIEPGIPYLVSATGPLKGARLLFANDRKANLHPRALDSAVAELGAHLGLGMQVMEDSLCNWQKSPDKFIAFRG